MPHTPRIAPTSAPSLTHFAALLCPSGPVRHTCTAHAHGSPATRAWCVYEWAHTLSYHGPDGLHMSLAPRDRAQLIASLDVTRAKCFKPEDEVAILADVVAQHGSAHAFNTKLKLQLLLEPLSYRVDLRRLQERAKGDGSWRLASIRKWLAEGSAGDGDGGGKRVLCISSGPGEGKSTISALLCDGGGRGGAVLGTDAIAAHHFLKYNDQRRLDTVRVIKSLAFQLAGRYMRGPNVHGGR
jgi:hypothetical protein